VCACVCVCVLVFHIAHCHFRSHLLGVCIRGGGGGCVRVWVGVLVSVCVYECTVFTSHTAASDLTVPVHVFARGGVCVCVCACVSVCVTY